MSRIEGGLRRCAGAVPRWCWRSASRRSRKHPAEAKVAALPQPLTRESMRELVARMSDDEVRELLLQQLDRAAAAAPANAKAGMGMAGMVDEHAGAMRTMLGDLEAAIALPDTLRQVGEKLVEPDGLSQLGVIAEHPGRDARCGFFIERLYVARCADFARGSADTAPTFTAKAFRLGLGLLLDIAGIIVWGIA